MNITPLRDLLVVVLLPDPARPKGLIEVVENKKNTATAEIVAIGPEVRDAKVGQRVVISRLQGTEVAGEPPRVVIREQGVLAYLEDTEA